MSARESTASEICLSPLTRARWRRAILSELAEPGYVDFALVPGERSKIARSAPTQVSPMAAKLLCLQAAPPWSRRVEDVCCAEGRQHLLEACHSVIVSGRDAAVTAQITPGQVDSVVVRKLFTSPASVSVQLTCPTAVARLRTAESALLSLDPAIEPGVETCPVRALVVDDNVDAATSMCDMLEVIGFETAVAFGGPECLEVAARFNPRLAFIDFDMPGMNCCQALAQLRLQESEFRRTFICLTGRSAPEDHRMCHEAGFDELVTKPISLDHLWEIAEPLVC
jgi:CheY-like chemotaxis protein